MSEYEWIINLLFMLVGYFLGNRAPRIARKDDKEPGTIKLPTLNPMDRYKEKQERKEEAQRELEMKKMLENIDAYDGTSNGQQDI